MVRISTDRGRGRKRRWLRQAWNGGRLEQGQDRGWEQPLNEGSYFYSSRKPQRPLRLGVAEYSSVISWEWGQEIDRRAGQEWGRKREEEAG